MSNLLYPHEYSVPFVVIKNNWNISLKMKKLLITNLLLKHSIEFTINTLQLKTVIATTNT